MAWNETLTALNHVLTGLYPFVEDSYRLVDTAGIPRAFVSFQRRAIDNWYQILSEADRRNKVLDLVKAALNDYPDNAVLIQAERGELRDVNGPIIDKDVGWRGTLSADTAEKLMEQQSSLLPVSFLETGILRARAVARIRLSTGALGTGFLITNNILVTNHHVLATKDEAATAVMQFNYQKTPLGLDLEPVPFSFAPEDGFATSEEDDWTLVKVKGDANAGWGAIKLAAIDASQVKRVNIIQHPSGGPKQIAIYHNIVAFADEKRVQYLTDTLPGSSGSPVFDDQWRVVALHHSGGWIVEPGTKNQVFRNEGININCVVTGLAQSGIV
jgi:V8-like Glu-specific endopeptidase